MCVHLPPPQHTHIHTQNPGTCGPDFPVIVTSFEIVMADIKPLSKYSYKVGAGSAPAIACLSHLYWLVVRRSLQLPLLAT